MATLQDMATFVAVVEQGSFSKAGQELRVSTAVVSARIARLESQIGVRLLNRTTRQVVPTEEARRYHEDCKAILKQVEDAEASLSSRKDNPSGSLRITAPIVFGRRYIAPLLPTFQEEYPDLQVRLLLSDSFVDIVGEGIDLAIRIADLPDSSMRMRKLGESPRIFCASPAYLAKNGTPQTPQDLLNHNCLLLRFPGSTQFQWRIHDGEKELTLPVTGTLDSNNGDVLRDWAVAGKGIVMKSRWEVEEELRSGVLVEILQQYTARPVPISVIHPHGQMTPPKVRLMVEFLADAFKNGF